MSRTIRVYEFEAKTLALIHSRIIPSVTTVEAFCKTTGINRANYYRINKNQRPSPTKENVRIVDVSNDILDGITRAYGVPISYFTKPYTKREFERLLDRGPWEVLYELQQSSAHCNLSAQGSEKTYRFGPPKTEDQPEPELGYFKIKDPIVFELTGWQNWNVILLNRRPDGRIVCLLPSTEQMAVKIPADGLIRLPDQGYWEVQAGDPPGMHQLMAIFHEKDWLQKELDLQWFSKQLTLESEVDQQRGVLSKLVDWLETQNTSDNKSFEVIVKELQVTSS